ncbi:iduronate-2-sulfatase [Oleiharenicola lentus]|uniref:Iduronate-2-sulfatase n=1 Tax=Oleiharenicola lentus TaxID=2508720 RepID=A0A4Q1CAP8_9BACT|nr:sulfatase [Oleiharenicola lentus]RXK55942.1 iduronate-2-sulfatase [Oleiharenicola lentus]
MRPYLLLFAGLTALCCGAPATTSAGKLNVLLITIDDLRDTLGCYGNPAVLTPHINRLAARAVRFDRAYVQYPVCNASRSSFLTGLRPDQTGVTDNHTILRERLPEVVTLPQLLKNDGRHSTAFGKILHLGGGRDEALRAQWADLPLSWHTARPYEATPRGRIKLAGRDLSNGKLSWCHWGAMDGDDDDQPDGQIARAVIEEIERCDDRPWVIGAGFMKPHDPFLAPKKYFDLYPEGSLRLTRPPGDQTPAPPLAVGFGGLGAAFAQFADRDREEFLRAYYACTTYVDAQVGRVLATLDRLNLWENTIVILLGDHGYHLGERDWWNKDTLFERTCRAPLLIAAPGIKPGVARGLVEFIDLYPTVAELCRLTPPPNLAGQSLLPLLRDPKGAGKPAAITIVVRGRSRGDSIRTDQWRFTRWSDGTSELYDHTLDPEEDHNVAAAHPDLIRDLSDRLSAALAAAGPGRSSPGP